MKPTLIEVDIVDLSRGGSGVGHLPEGKVVFTPFTMPGDSAEIEIIETKKNYLQGKLIKLLKPSSDRVKPPCDVFTQCGGCQWQHLPYELQWKTKLKGVREALKRQFKIELPKIQEFPSSQIWNYRTRIQLHHIDHQLGYFAPHSHQFVPIQECYIAHPLINKALHDIQNDKKIQSHSRVEISTDEKGIVSWRPQAPYDDSSFRQINEEQNKKLQKWVISHYHSEPLILDLYSGNGNLSKALWGNASTVICVDNYAPTQDSHEHIQFISESVPHWLRRNVHRFNVKKHPCLAILDPPRAGLDHHGHEIARSLKECGVTSALLVSCHPDSLARDLKALTLEGFQIRELAAFDFFPQTIHIESVAKLSF